jgi:hypothetical protein
MKCVSCDSPDLNIILEMRCALGNVGNRRYYRCNRCGLEWNRKIEQIEDNKVTEDYLRGLPRKNH